MANVPPRYAQLPPMINGRDKSRSTGDLNMSKTPPAFGGGRFKKPLLVQKNSITGNAPAPYGRNSGGNAPAPYGRNSGGSNPAEAAENIPQYFIGTGQKNLKPTSGIDITGGFDQGSEGGMLEDQLLKQHD